MELELDHEVDGRYDVLVPRGEVDIATHTGLRDRMASLVESGRSHLVVDLSETTFLDSTALGCLIGGRARAVEAGGSFAVIVKEPRILRLFEVTRLIEVLTLHDTRSTWSSAVATG